MSKNSSKQRLEVLQGWLSWVKYTSKKKNK